MQDVAGTNHGIGAKRAQDQWAQNRLRSLNAKGHGEARFIALVVDALEAVDEESRSVLSAL